MEGSLNKGSSTHYIGPKKFIEDNSLFDLGYQVTNLFGIIKGKRIKMLFLAGSISCKSYMVIYILAQC